MASVLDHNIIYAVKGTTLDKRICDPIHITTLIGSKEQLFNLFHSLAHEKLREKFPETEWKKTHGIALIQWIANHYSSTIPKNRKILVTNIKVLDPEGCSAIICAEIYSVKVDKTE